MSPHRPLAALLLPFLLAAATPANPPPATRPTLDLSTPRAAYITYERLLLAANLDAAESCIVPPATPEDRHAFRASQWPLVLGCALVNIFGPEKAVNYANWPSFPTSEIARAETATETITGDTAQLITTGPGGTSTINLRKIDTQWRVVIPRAPASPTQRALQKSDSEFAAHLLTDLRAGKQSRLGTITDVENQLALHESANAVLRRVEPIYLPPKLDPQGLRLKVVATPAAASSDHLFHIDSVLQNAGQKDLHLLVGMTRGDASWQLADRGVIEAINKDGVPLQIPTASHIGYEGPPLLPWIITLHPGDTFTLRPQIPFSPPPPRIPQPVPERVRRDYAAQGRPVPEPPPAPYIHPGTYTFTATYSFAPDDDTYFLDTMLFKRPNTPPLPDNLWTGTVLSDSITLTIPESP